jgi:hypothetical protein
MGFVRTAFQLSDLLTQPLNLFRGLYQLPLVKDYQPLSLSTSPTHFFELALHYVGLAKENLSSIGGHGQYPDSWSSLCHSNTWMLSLSGQGDFLALFQN